MVKYFVTFVLLFFLALENNSLYSHIYAHPSGDANSSQYASIRHQQSQTHHTRHSQRQHHQQHHHTHRQHLQQQHQPEANDSNEEEDGLTAEQQQNEHLLRHLQHQYEQRQQHLQLYREKQAAMNLKSNLRTMPRIWQHLQQADDEEHMFADSPANASEERVATIETPPASIEDEGVGGESDMPDKFEESINNSLESEAAGHAKHSQPHMRCPKCESSRKVARVSEEELTQLRIEFVKQQILEKLRLKEPPNVSAVGLPKPIYEGTTIDQGDDQTKSKDLDDYYARTSKKFIFLERETHECQRLGAHPALCFSFKIDDADADGFDVNTAVLWIFKNKLRKSIRRNDTVLDQETIVVSEVQQQLDAKYLPMVKTIAIQSVDVQDEWMKIDIEWPIKRWFGNHELSHLIQISCQSCDINSMHEMISIDQDYRPFIMVDTQNRRRSSRQKRGINCTDGVTECCREKLYISFDEIGWGDWIIQPRGYDAYFCRGSCSSVASVSQSASHHSSFLQKVFSTRGKGNRKALELIPCCTAKQYSSLQLVFMDSNNTATQKTFPNMVVESCGCR